MEFLRANWVWLLLVAGASGCSFAAALAAAWGAAMSERIAIATSGRASQGQTVEDLARGRLARPSTRATVAIVAAEGAET